MSKPPTSAPEVPRESPPPPPTSHLTQAIPRVIAGCSAMAAFSVAIVAGLTRDNPAGEVLVRAIVSMIVCYPAGYLVGFICRAVINQHIHEHESANPAPSEGDPEATSASDEQKPAEVVTV